MKVKVYKDFLNLEDCQALNDFALACVKGNIFTDGMLSKSVNKPNAQMVSRFNKNIVFTELALQIQKQLQEKFNLPDESINKQFHKQGIIVNVSFNGAQVVRHKDGSKEGYSALRCNIITSQPDNGGILHVSDSPIELKQGDLYTCLVSEYEHYVSKNKSDTPRIVWQFAFDVKKEHWSEYGLSRSNA